MQKTNKKLRLYTVFTTVTALLLALYFLSSTKISHNLLINYQAPNNQQDKASLKLLKNESINELVADTINDLFIIPEPLSITYNTQHGPEYDAETRRILMPYFFIQEVKQRFIDDNYSESGVPINDAIMDVVIHTLLHELAHALIDIYDLPIVVKEEDAADSLATMLLIEFFEDGQEIAITAADLFDLESGNTQSFAEADFWDEHSLDVQRYYNTLCAVYGSAPEDYLELMKDAEFSDEKAEQCIDDYEQLYFSWMTLLKPHLKKTQLREF